jgi:hypothetical protein
VQLEHLVHPAVSSILLTLLVIIGFITHGDRLERRIARHINVDARRW